MFKVKPLATFCVSCSPESMLYLLWLCPWKAADCPWLGFPMLKNGDDNSISYKKSGSLRMQEASVTHQLFHSYQDEIVDLALCNPG